MSDGVRWMLEFRRRVGALPSSLADRQKDFGGEKEKASALGSEVRVAFS